jgi:hypothetical protein
MNQTEGLAGAKVNSVVGALLAIVAFFSSLGVFISLWSIWVEWWVYLIVATIAVAGFILGYIARRHLIQFGVYNHSNFYQGTAAISLGCSTLALLILVSLFYLAVSSVR